MTDGRRLAVLTTGRQDYGILRSTILLLRRTSGFEVAVWAGGMHLQRRFGEPLEAFTRDGVPVARELAFLAEPPNPVADTAAALAQVGAALTEDGPDALILVGDRSEALAAGLAATIARVPIVHLHGGEESEGAIDNACRHALTKLSHLHLVSHQVHRDRVVQMGEDPASVVVVGAPALDHAYRDDLPGPEALARDLGVALEPPVVVVTMHPATLGAPAGEEVAAVAGAMARVPATYVVTAPNADAGGTEIGDYWRAWARDRQRVALVDALGDRRYWAMLRLADAVLGNSSSGIIEAPALGVPVVNVGDRQRGRLRYGPVTDVAPAAEAVATALRDAIAAGRRAPGSDLGGYPPAPVAPRIVEALRRWEIPQPPRKRFRALG
ncbi:MAG TPA: UDP-N-acetylglucosamine 2-epimerase [Gemmatimonadales bacterium]|nr:UDP-N-acetylglucosamine 2-epimerase [Gemmatimonadales bacterium]